MSQDDTLIVLSRFRKNIKDMMSPQVLEELAKFLEATQYGDASLVERYDWFCNNAENGPDCRYAAMAKNLFLADQAETVAATINWLYHNFSKVYEEK